MIDIFDIQGKQASCDDKISHSVVSKLEELLQLHGDHVPHGSQWLAFQPAINPDMTDEAGRLTDNPLLPSPSDYKRMWAGGEYRLHQALVAGQPIKRESLVKNVTTKQNKDGIDLYFIDVEHQYLCRDECHLTETLKMVFIPKNKVGSANKAQAVEWEAEQRFDYTFKLADLFCYSALTYNPYRIHYDLSFCREEEGYPNAVVHGPMLATLMLNLAEQHFHQPVTEASYRFLAPAFCQEPLTVAMAEVEGKKRVWVENGKKQLICSAEIGA